jgi:hypothetical protein
MRLLLIEGAIFNEHDAWNISVFMEWSRDWADDKFGNFNGMEKLILARVKHFFGDFGINFPLAIYKD